MESRFILSIDGSSVSRKAENFAREVLDPERHSVLVTHVVETAPLDALGKENEMDSLKNHLSKEAKVLLEETSERLRSEGFQVETRSLAGDPGEEICKLVEDVDAKGVILGRTGRSRLEEVLLGSVGDYVIRHADCSVTTVPAS